MVLTKRTANLPLICQICGDVARGINFEVMTCMSCKAFFRRHALQSANALQCQLDGNCKITQITRGGCSACRLKKCFSFGMNPRLIRHITQNHYQLVKKKSPVLPMPLPLNLLRNDISTLTNMEWTLLSNIIHAYDHTNPIEHTKMMLQQQSTLPPKLRTKSTVTLDIIAFFYSTFQSFIERVPYFQDLPIDQRRILVQHNSETTGAFNSVFIVRETNALDCPAYAVGCSTVYGNENYQTLQKFISQLEPNGALFKVMLLLIGFSGNCSIVIPHNTRYMPTSPNVISLIHIQNTIVTMFWKYLNYQYGFSGAVKCFSSYIRFILGILRWIETGYIAQHGDMLDTIVESIDRSLVVSN